MTITLVILFWISGFAIFYAMIGYPLVLIFLDKLFKPKKHDRDYAYMPSVTIMVVAHNEEKVIQEKLKNVSALDYPSDKLEILVASDNSTDVTNEIVKTFIQANPEKRIRLFEVKERKGKTNAQNEAQKLCDTEILVMTDANAMLEPSAVRELVSSFTSDDIAYVSGRLAYKNADSSGTAQTEGIYWKIDLKCREIESRIQTITAGNGAIYAVRNSCYEDIPPIECHDFSFPLRFALQKKRAIYNKDAVAIEKAGETNEDEFKRKVRMFRTILHDILPTPRILNVFQYKWFSFFYFGHRTCRYSLWLAHAMLLVLNIPLSAESPIWLAILIAQCLFYLVAYLNYKGINVFGRIGRMANYYCMTVLAQCKGVLNIISGKTKPTWEKAESTR